jgi:hypothetical protein
VVGSEVEYFDCCVFLSSQLSASRSGAYIRTQRNRHSVIKTNYLPYINPNL